MNKILLSILFFGLMAFTITLRAEPANNKNTVYIIVPDSLLSKINADSALVKKIISIDGQKKKKLVSALFAFPFPFGFMGAHRVMLGTKPWVPVVYVCTLGGCFGLLPLIDFCVIIFSKNIEQYENNPNIFMWIK